MTELSKESKFFIFLLNMYAAEKGCRPINILHEWNQKHATEFIRDSYEMYHQESLENAFKEIDHFLETGEPLYV